MASLEQRLNSILPPEPQTDIPVTAEIIQEDQANSMDGVQLAGVADFFTKPAKVIGKAFSSKSSIAGSVMDDAAGKAAQQIVEDVGAKAETTGTQGLKQSIQINSQIKKAADELLPYGQAKSKIEKSVGKSLTKDQQTKLKQATKGKGSNNADELVTQPAEVPTAAQPEIQNVIDAATDELPSTGFQGVFITRASEEDAAKFVSGYGEEVDKVDFNFNYLQSDQDIDKAINATSEIFAKDIDEAKRGVMSDQAVQDMAARLNITPDLLNAKIGTTFNAEQMVAARHLLVKSANQLDTLAGKIKTMAAGTEDDKLLLEFRDQLATHGAIQMRLKAAQTEVARSLRSFRLPVDGSTGLSDPQQIASLLNDMGGRANMKNIASAYLDLTVDQQSRFVDLAGTTTQQMGKVWKELYQMSLMSSTNSAERNFFANMTSLLARSADTAFASTVGKAVDKTIVTPLVGSNSADEVFMSEAIIEFGNFIYSLPKGLQAGLKAFATDTPVYKVGRDIDRTPDPAITAKLFADPDTPIAQGVDFLGKVVRLPGRANLAGDEFAKAVLATMENRRLAARDALLAMKNGVDETKALDGMAMQLSNPSARLIDKIDQSVVEGTLQSDLGSFGNFLMSTRNKMDNLGAGPIGTFIAPYIKTVVNAQKQMLARTPIGQLALKEIREDYMAGGARRQMAMGKFAQGAAFMGLASYLAMDGTCTGAGPTDPERKKFLRETTGWQPFSCKVGDAYYSYAGLEPIGGMLAIGTTLAEIGSVYGKENDDEWNDLLLYSAVMPFKYVSELPFLSGMAKFVTMIEEAKRDPKSEQAHAASRAFFGNAAQNMVGGVVPVPMPFSGLLRQIEDTLDPVRREVTVDASLSSEHKYFDFMFRSFLAKTPLLNSEIPVSRNLWGAEIKTGDNSALKWIIPFNRMETDLDADENRYLEIAKARGSMPFRKPDKSIANVTMNDGEYSDMLLYMNQIQIDGKGMRQAMMAELVDPVSMQQMQAGAYEGVSQKLSKVISEFKEETISSPVFAAKHPDFVRQVQKNQKAAELKYQQSIRVPLESID
jgi:hypothetical protein